MCVSQSFGFVKSYSEAKIKVVAKDSTKHIYHLCIDRFSFWFYDSWIAVALHKPPPPPPIHFAHSPDQFRKNGIFMQMQCMCKKQTKRFSVREKQAVE